MVTLWLCWGLDANVTWNGGFFWAQLAQVANCWAQVEGERILLRTALRALANQRFVLLSETCLPLGPPHVLYLQYLSEPLARINACKQDTVEDAYRRGLDR